MLMYKKPEVAFIKLNLPLCFDFQKLTFEARVLYIFIQNKIIKIYGMKGIS